MALEIGSGRVFIMGEAAALTAQVDDRGNGSECKAETTTSSSRSTSCTGCRDIRRFDQQMSGR
jgi:hypothetical protein